MIIEQLIKEKRKIKYRYLSEHSQRGKIAARYIDYSPIPKLKKVQTAQPQSVSCTIQLTGSSCQLEVGKIDIETKNEPTESLKNMKKSLHPRIVPSAPLFSHDPKYGGWDDPYQFRAKPQKKKKYEYY